MERRLDMTGFRRIVCAVMCLLFLAAAASAGAEQVSLKTVQKALDYVRKNQPAELDLGEVKMKPQELKKIRDAMPAGGVLHFTSKWGALTFTDRDEEINLNVLKGGVSRDALVSILEVVPTLKKLTCSKHYRMSNEVMVPLLTQYPQVEFVWHISLNGNHSLNSADTAYSTFNTPTEKHKLTSTNLENLQYAKGIKALDLGHNKITSLEFLRFFPDIEFLILGDNPIEDLTPLGELKHLQYLEMFSVKATDLSPLANCTELLDLNLTYCSGITDLSPLDGIQTLERCWLSHMSGITAEEEARFIEKHPTAECNFHGGDATGDGWRHHPRFKHYKTCLKSHQWVSFSEIKAE